MTLGGRGWSEEAYDLLLRLQGKPQLSVLDAHREEYDRLVRQPMHEVCDALGEVGGYGRAWPSARSANPSTWQRTGATIWVARRVHLTTSFDLDGLQVEGGWTGKYTEQLWHFRAMVDADSSGSELEDVLAELSKDGYVLDDDRITKDAPGLLRGPCPRRVALPPDCRRAAGPRQGSVAALRRDRRPRPRGVRSPAAVDVVVRRPCR